MDGVEAKQENGQRQDMNKLSEVEGGSVYELLALVVPKRLSNKVKSGS